jgi:hypothetical protein
MYVTDRTAKNIAREQGLLRLDRSDGLLIRVIFDLPNEEGVLTAFFECGTCGEVIMSAPSSHDWQCPGCEYELSSVEAEGVIVNCHAALSQLNSDIRFRQGRSRWGWGQLLRMLLLRLLSKT